MDAMRKTHLAALAALTLGSGLLAGCVATDVLVPYADPTPTAAIPVSDPIPATPLQMAQPAMTAQASVAPTMPPIAEAMSGLCASAASEAEEPAWMTKSNGGISFMMSVEQLLRPTTMRFCANKRRFVLSVVLTHEVARLMVD